MKGKKIFVLEDEVIISMLVEDMLLDLGAEICGPTGDLAEGLDMARNGDFDAALLDLNLNGKSSTEVADVLASRGIPFAFATGYSHSPMSGYDDVPILQKPYTQTDLAKLFADLLNLG